MPADVPTTGPNLRSKNERPPVEPLLATQHTQAGAKAFAKFFIQTIDWAYATTSTTYMRHYFNHQCVNCRNIANSVDLSRRRGHHFIGDRFTIRRSMAADPGARLVTVAVVFDVNAGEIVDSHGRYVDGLGALTAYREQVALSWLEDRWQVDAIRPLQ